MMTDEKLPQDATLLDLLIDGFEKNEMLDGFHQRTLPMPNDDAAAGKFTEFLGEARCWKGEPVRHESRSGRQLVQWPDMEIRQAGSGVVVRVKGPRFRAWWHQATTWAGDPMQPIFDWIDEETASDRSRA